MFIPILSNYQEGLYQNSLSMECSWIGEWPANHLASIQLHQEKGSIPLLMHVQLHKVYLIALCRRWQHRRG